MNQYYCEAIQTMEDLNKPKGLREIIGSVSVYSQSEAIDNISQMLASDSTNHLVTLNVESSMAIMRDPSHYKALTSAEMVTPDSSGIIWALKELQGIDAQRVTGVDLAEQLFRQYPRETGVTFFFLGSQDQTRIKAIETLTQRFDIGIAGECGGIYGEDDPEILANLNEAEPTIIIMAGIAPKAESWIYQHKTQLPKSCRIIMNTGQGINLWGGDTQRAPDCWQKINLEWLYRLLQDPQRRLKRQMGALPAFAIQVMKEARTSRKSQS